MAAVIEVPGVSATPPPPEMPEMGPVSSWEPLTEMGHGMPGPLMLMDEEGQPKAIRLLGLNRAARRRLVKSLRKEYPALEGANDTVKMLVWMSDQGRRAGNYWHCAVCPSIHEPGTIGYTWLRGLLEDVARHSGPLPEFRRESLTSISRMVELAWEELEERLWGKTPRPEYLKLLGVWPWLEKALTTMEGDEFARHEEVIVLGVFALSAVLQEPWFINQAVRMRPELAEQFWEFQEEERLRTALEEEEWDDYGGDDESLVHLDSALGAFFDIPGNTDQETELALTTEGGQKKKSKSERTSKKKRKNGKAKDDSGFEGAKESTTEARANAAALPLTSIDVMEESAPPARAAAIDSEMIAQPALDAAGVTESEVGPGLASAATETAAAIEVPRERQDDRTLMRLYEEANETLTASVRHLEEKVEGLNMAKLLIEDERDEAVRERRRLEARIEHLEHALTAKNGREDFDYPADYEGVAEWTSRYLGNSVVLAKRAERSLKRARYRDVRRVCDCVVLLGQPYRDMRRGVLSRAEFDAKCDALGVTLEQVGEMAEGWGDEYKVLYCGEKRTMTMHLKRGNSRDPAHCLRIYFFWDESNERVVIGHLPSHLRCAST